MKPENLPAITGSAGISRVQRIEPASEVEPRIYTTHRPGKSPVIILCVSAE